MTELQESYPNGVCPDCGLPIDAMAEEGQECLNCGHVFWIENDRAGDNILN